MPLQGIQGPLQQIVSEMPGQINSYVDEEIQRRMDEMKTTPSPTPTPTDPVGPPQDPFQDPSPFPMPRPFPGIGGGRLFFLKIQVLVLLPPGIFWRVTAIFYLTDLEEGKGWVKGPYQIPRPHSRIAEYI
jgi:hypothetical protein